MHTAGWHHMDADMRKAALTGSVTSGNPKAPIARSASLTAGATQQTPPAITGTSASASWRRRRDAARRRRWRPRSTRRL
eukprot:jgi/Mesen1/4774/ME000242S03946